MASYVGIDIGQINAKFAYRSGSGIVNFESRMPENMIDQEKVVAPATMAQFLKGVRKKNHVRATNAALVLPESQTYFRHLTLPMMTVSELEINLPYEFRDFIEGDPDSYYYDYIVDDNGSTFTVDDEGNSTQTGLVLYAAAVKKETIDNYGAMLRKAGFKLKLAIPVQMAYMRFMRKHIQANPADVDKEVVFVDLGYNGMTISLFRGSSYMASRTIDWGCHEFDVVIAEQHNIDEFTASSYKFNNFEGVMDSPACADVCQRIALEVNKVINFYNFNNPDAEVSQLYYLGGGSEIPQVRDTIAVSVSMPCVSATSLYPPEAQHTETGVACALAIAGLLDAEEVL